MYAHRLSFRLSNPDKDMLGFLVCHRCDTPLCCNPHHLFLGTDKDNAVDRENKKRSNPKKGSKHHAAKFTEDQIKDIRLKYDREKISQKKLAKIYGVSQSVIGDITRNIAWKHV